MTQFLDTLGRKIDQADREKAGLISISAHQIQFLYMNTSCFPSFVFPGQAGAEEKPQI